MCARRRKQDLLNRSSKDQTLYDECVDKRAPFISKATKVARAELIMECIASNGKEKMVATTSIICRFLLLISFSFLFFCLPGPSFFARLTKTNVRLVKQQDCLRKNKFKYTGKDKQSLSLLFFFTELSLRFEKTISTMSVLFA